jgi:hypothetical protein
MKPTKHYRLYVNFSIYEKHTCIKNNVKKIVFYGTEVLEVLTSINVKKYV